MSRGRLAALVAVLVGVAALCWLAVAGMGLSPVDGERVGCGAAVVVVPAVLAPVLLPRRRRNGSFAEAVARRPVPDDDVPASLRSLEFAARFATTPTGAYDLHFRLRPVLAEVAAHRLGQAHGIDLAGSPEEARALLGPLLYEVVRPERPAPQDKRGPGLTPAELARAVDILEAL